VAVSVAELQKVLGALEEALSYHGKATDEVVAKMYRDACIQRFEFCIELAWKVSGRILGSSSTTAKPVLREMAQNGLITNLNLWFDFIDARNNSSHTYDEDLAKSVFEIIEKFLPEGQSLIKALQTK